MKNSLATMCILGLVGAAPIIGWGGPVLASNSGVEVGLQGSGDLSMFYQGLLSTGVINELNENERYTIFAPVNTAFVQIPRVSYPCFYSEQCRPQIAALLRDHIIVGRHDLADLVTYGSGIQTAGLRRIHIDELYVNDYAVEDEKILSATEIGGNIIYRINGVITDPQELAQFQAVNVVPVADTVTTEKTVIQKTYHTPIVSPDVYPGGAMVPVAPGGPSDASGTTTTVIRTYRTQPQ